MKGRGGENAEQKKQKKKGIVRPEGKNNLFCYINGKKPENSVKVKITVATNAA